MTLLESKLFNMENNKNLKTMLFDSLIIAAMSGIAVFSDTPNIENLWLVAKVGGLAFFSQLAFEKKIKPWRENR